tara:strand:- start:365 stop:538 length:174 start_codon:yes stop_codon:yes gene_type:complete
MKRFKTKAQAQKYLDLQTRIYDYGLSIYLVPMKYRVGRHKAKPYAVTNYMLWINFGY